MRDGLKLVWFGVVGMLFSAVFIMIAVSGGVDVEETSEGNGSVDTIEEGVWSMEEVEIEITGMPEAFVEFSK